MTDQATDADRPTDMSGHREVTLPIGLLSLYRIDLVEEKVGYREATLH